MNVQLGRCSKISNCLSNVIFSFSLTVSVFTTLKSWEVKRMKGVKDRKRKITSVTIGLCIEDIEKKKERERKSVKVKKKR